MIDNFFADDLPYIVMGVSMLILAGVGFVVRLRKVMGKK